MKSISCTCLRVFNKLKNKISKIGYISVIVFILFFLGGYLDNKIISLVAVMMLFFYNIIDAIIKQKSGFIYYIIFNLSIFVFILSRPVIASIRGYEWLYFNDYTIYVALFILLLTMLSLNVGFNFSYTKVEKDHHILKKYDNRFYSIKKITCVILSITLISNFLKESIILMKYYGNYTSLYTGLDIQIPVLITILSGMTTFWLLFYLALLPSKKSSMLFCLVYLITGIPALVNGNRNVIMIKALFCIVYFILRDNMDKINEWIGKKEKIAMISLIPVVIVGLGVINYTREDSDIPSFSPVEIGVDFFYKQGTSFDTLCQTIENREKLRDDNYINYTFGEVIDFALHNKISNLIFGTRALDDGNGIYNATESNNLAHRISYIVLGDTYLSGHGRGTTYFSEIYLDFGYLGIILFNLLIGFLFSRVNKLFSNSVISRILIMNILFYMFMIPRLSFFSMFSFVINYYFWIVSIIILLLVYFKVNIKTKS